jgi:DNA repair exonuclease SbcCD ATPase subunit
MIKGVVPRYRFPKDWKKRLLRSLRVMEKEGVVISGGYSKLSFRLAEHGVRQGKVTEAIVSQVQPSETPLSMQDTIGGESTLASEWSIPQFEEDPEMQSQVQLVQAILAKPPQTKVEVEKYNLASLLARKIVEREHRGHRVKDKNQHLKEKLAILEPKNQELEDLQKQLGVIKGEEAGLMSSEGDLLLAIDKADCMLSAAIEEVAVLQTEIDDLYTVKARLVHDQMELEQELEERAKHLDELQIHSSQMKEEYEKMIQNARLDSTQRFNIIVERAESKRHALESKLNEKRKNLEDEEDISRKELAVLKYTVANDDELFNMVIELAERLQVMVQSHKVKND